MINGDLMGVWWNFMMIWLLLMEFNDDLMMINGI
jgi:hypothetical protein